jgi:hypothetical protein
MNCNAWNGKCEIQKNALRILYQYYTKVRLDPIQPETEKNVKGCVSIDNTTWTKMMNTLKNRKASGTDINNLEHFNKPDSGLWYFTYKTMQDM